MSQNYRDVFKAIEKKTMLVGSITEAARAWETMLFETLPGAVSLAYGLGRTYFQPRMGNIPGRCRL